MWLSPETEHTCRGNFRGTHLCIRCHTPIETGQRYRRRVWRPRRRKFKRLIVDHEHIDEDECPYWLEDEMHDLERVAECVPLSIRLVAKEVVVVAYDTAGNPFTETKTVLQTELVVGGAEQEADDGNFDDEDIPF